jgi:hypothetical protein
MTSSVGFAEEGVLADAEDAAFPGDGGEGLVALLPAFVLRVAVFPHGRRGRDVARVSDHRTIVRSPLARATISGHGPLPILYRRVCIVEVSCGQRTGGTRRPRRGEPIVSATPPVQWALRTSGPIYLRTRTDPQGAQRQRPLCCPCGRTRERLILPAADRDVIEVLCRCGRRQTLRHVALSDVNALVEAVPAPPGGAASRQAFTGRWPWAHRGAPPRVR